ncbi:hypothetical protein A2U01_0065323, partial [Trifolium medium]|nr:hypothetical protein [Trifolium medium]
MPARSAGNRSKAARRASRAARSAETCCAMQK